MKVEKLTPKRINKDTSPAATGPDGSRQLLPGEILDALNCDYRNGVVKSIPGTVAKAVEELSGTSEVVGAIANTRDNTCIYFVKNSDDSHRVYEYNPAADTVVTLLGDSSLGLTTNVHGAVLGGFLIFNDGVKRIRKVNLARARAGGYSTPYTEQQLSLRAYPPVVPPTLSSVTDGTKDYNYISDNNWQFAFRYVYIDNEESVFSPLSLPAFGQIIPDPTNTANNGIGVTFSLPADLVGLVKRVDIAYRIGNDGDYYIFKKVFNPVAGAQTCNFFNDSTAEVVDKRRQTALYDGIPRISDAVEIIDNRVFFSLNEAGFDVDESLFDLVIAPDTTAAGDISGYVGFCKEGAVHGVGIVFFDEAGTPSFVKKKQFITIPRKPLFKDFNTLAVASTTTRIQWTLSGTPPPGMVKYAIVMTKDTAFSAYAECMAMPFKYTREIRDDEEDDKITNISGSDVRYYNWRGKRFADISHTPDERDARLYLQVPLNLPFVPQAGDHVFVKNEDFPDRHLYVYDVVGDFLDVGYSEFGIIHDLSAWKNIFIEISRPSKNRNTEKFFETGNEFFGVMHDIVGGVFSQLNANILGDTFAVKLYPQQSGTIPTTKQFYYYDFIPPLQKPSGGSVTLLQGSATVKAFEQVVETPVRIMSPVMLLVDVLTGSTRVGNSGSPLARDNGEVITLSSQKRVSVYSFDYSKISGGYGRVHTSNENERKQNYDTTFAYSDPFIQNSFVNGLNVVPPDQVYTVPVDRGRTRALKRAGNVLLAIHENSTSTMYIGEGLIREGQNFLLAKVDKVVGDDRELLGSYGTINPESVIEVFHNVFFWDGLNGAVVRYTNAGLYPISNYKMHDYFLAKSRELLPYKDIAKVVTGFDYQNNELLITFRDVIVDDVVVVPGVTWAFNLRDSEWKTRYSFLPECYGTLKIGLSLFSAGKLWKYRKSGTYNNFFGVQYERMFRAAINPQLGKNKKFLNVHIAGNICQDPTGEFTPFKIYTPEGQESNTPAYEFELDEGKWCGPVLKDINTPNVPGSRLALRSGDDIVSNYAEVEIINDRTDESPCSQVNVVYKDEEFSI